MHEDPHAFLLPEYMDDEEKEMLDVTETSTSSDEEDVPVPESEGSPLQDDVSHCGASLGLLQEMHVDSINGCDEQVEEWEEVEFLVDSGAREGPGSGREGV